MTGTGEAQQMDMVLNDIAISGKHFQKGGTVFEQTVEQQAESRNWLLGNATVAQQS